MSSPINMSGRIAIITGASRGIGAAVAKRYASLGAHVILIARTVTGLEQVDDEIRREGKGQATLVPMDISEPEKIEQLSAAIAKRYGKLDILVGNAAMLGGLTPITHIADEIWNQVININLTANWRFIRAFDPLLRQSEYGRAIFVTSGVTKAVYPYWGAYSVSKSALEMLVRIYASEIENTNVKANLVDPGVVRTLMRAEAFPGENPYIHPKPESITDIFVELTAKHLKKNGEKFNAQ